MLDPMEATKRWKLLKSAIDKVKDPILRDSILANYQQRAIKEWGYCPDKNGYKAKEEEIVLQPWQQDLLDRIQIAKEYGIWKKDEAVEREALCRMKSFIDSGGVFSDLPKDLQNEHIQKLYNKAFDLWLKDLDFFIKNT